MIIQPKNKTEFNKALNFAFTDEKSISTRKEITIIFGQRKAVIRNIPMTHAERQKKYTEKNK